MANKVSLRQIVAKVDGWSTPERPYFSQTSGGNVTAAVQKVYDGGAIFPDTLCAPLTVADLVLTRPFELETDAANLTRYRSQVGQARFAVHMFVLNCDLQVPGTLRTFPNALLMAMAEPEGDAASGNTANFSLTFSVSTVV